MLLDLFKKEIEVIYFKYEYTKINYLDYIDILKKYRKYWNLTIYSINEYFDEWGTIINNPIYNLMVIFDKSIIYYNNKINIIKRFSLNEDKNFICIITFKLFYNNKIYIEKNNYIKNDRCELYYKTNELIKFYSYMGFLRCYINNVLQWINYNSRNTILKMFNLIYIENKIFYKINIEEEDSYDGNYNIYIKNYKNFIFEHIIKT